MFVPTGSSLESDPLGPSSRVSTDMVNGASSAMGLPRKATTSKCLACLFVSLNKKKTTLRVTQDFIPVLSSDVQVGWCNIREFSNV
ncbi:hypothetical protein Tco_1273475 [Tanacetum coccineum]